MFYYKTMKKFLKNLLLSEHNKAFLYFVMGGALFSILLLNKVDKITSVKESKLVYLSSVQSCYFSLTKQSPIDEPTRLEFCQNLAKDSARNYADISDQMNKIIDQKYEFNLGKGYLYE